MPFVQSTDAPSQSVPLEDAAWKSAIKYEERSALMSQLNQQPNELTDVLKKRRNAELVARDKGWQKQDTEDFRMKPPMASILHVSSLKDMITSGVDGQGSKNFDGILAGLHGPHAKYHPVLPRRMERDNLFQAHPQSHAVIVDDELQFEGSIVHDDSNGPRKRPRQPVAFGEMPVTAKRWSHRLSSALSVCLCDCPQSMGA